ncbi:MAG: hypothetical protein Q4G63_12860 [Bacteroidia bacterium]|nr:hypothetical protein [Bacteroidia bacterium]
MSNISKIYQKKWNFEVYAVDKELVITVIFFGVIDYYRSFYLESNKIPKDLDDLESLAEDIRKNYNLYKYREIIPAIWQ